MQWTVVTVIIALVGLVIAICSPLIKNVKERATETKENTQAMTQLTMSIKNLSEKLMLFENNNTQAHRRLWQHNDKQDKLLEDFSKRITILEHTK